MGTSVAYKSKQISDVEFFEPIFGEGVILKLERSNGCMYAACKDTSGRIFAVVIKCDNGYSGDNFAYKIMDEFCGPHYSACPNSVFKLLSPLSEFEADTHETMIRYARNWRREVSATIACMKSGAKIKKNDIVQFASPIKFANGAEATSLQFMQRNEFWVPSLGFMCKLPRSWKRIYQWELV